MSLNVVNKGTRRAADLSPGTPPLAPNSIEQIDLWRYLNKIDSTNPRDSTRDVSFKELLHAQLEDQEVPTLQSLASVDIPKANLSAEEQANLEGEACRILQLLRQPSHIYKGNASAEREFRLKIGNLHEMGVSPPPKEFTSSNLEKDKKNEDDDPETTPVIENRKFRVDENNTAVFYTREIFQHLLKSMYLLFSSLTPKTNLVNIYYRMQYLAKDYSLSVGDHPPKHFFSQPTVFGRRFGKSIAESLFSALGKGTEDRLEAMGTPDGDLSFSFDECVELFTFPTAHSSITKFADIQARHGGIIDSQYVSRSIDKVSLSCIEIATAPSLRASGPEGFRNRDFAGNIMTAHLEAAGDLSFAATLGELHKEIYSSHDLQNIDYRNKLAALMLNRLEEADDILANTQEFLKAEDVTFPGTYQDRVQSNQALSKVILKLLSSELILTAAPQGQTSNVEFREKSDLIPALNGQIPDASNSAHADSPNLTSSLYLEQLLSKIDLDLIEKMAEEDFIDGLVTAIEKLPYFFNPGFVPETRGNDRKEYNEMKAQRVAELSSQAKAELQNIRFATPGTEISNTGTINYLAMMYILTKCTCHEVSEELDGEHIRRNAWDTSEVPLVDEVYQDLFYTNPSFKFYDPETGKTETVDRPNFQQGAKQASDILDRIENGEPAFGQEIKDLLTEFGYDV